MLEIKKEMINKAIEKNQIAKKQKINCQSYHSFLVIVFVEVCLLTILFNANASMLDEANNTQRKSDTND